MMAVPRIFNTTAIGVFRGARRADDPVSFVAVVVMENTASVSIVLSYIVSNRRYQVLVSETADAVRR